VKMMDKNGQEQQKTFQLSKDTHFRNKTGEAAKIQDFREGDEVQLTMNAGQVTELKKSDRATITNVDTKAGTVTVKMKDASGKDVQRTFHLTEDAEYIDSTGRVAALNVFRSGD